MAVSSQPKIQTGLHAGNAKNLSRGSIDSASAQLELDGYVYW